MGPIRDPSDAVDLRKATPCFPSTWPWQTLYPFCDELLATVYANSPDLWQELRSTCTAVSSLNVGQ
jgi:hypothetical protein